MSFGFDLKKELTDPVVKGDALKYAELYGMLLFCDRFSDEEICLTTEHEHVLSLFCERLSQLFDIYPQITHSTHKGRRTATFYMAQIETAQERETIRRAYGFSATDPLRINSYIDTVSPEGIALFLRGAYLVCGNITDPQKSYHLEFVTLEKELAEDLQLLVSGYIANTGLSMRKGQYLVYIKDSEAIEDLITFIGAKFSALEIMNIKIYKDLRNRANRLTNCETANIEKTIAASSKQVEDIQYLVDHRGIESLPDHLREIALLRLENPELSLSELGEMLSEPITRSGVNHRLKKLSDLAERLRAEMK